MVAAPSFCPRRAVQSPRAVLGGGRLGAGSPGEEPKPKKPKAKPITETTVMHDGYTIRPPSLIYK